MIPQRLIVEDIITEYLIRSNKEDAFRDLGMEVNGLLSNKLLDWAMDIIGFPPDNTLEFKDEYDQRTIGLRVDYDHEFCRDYLYNSSLIDEGCSDNVHSSVQEYADYLYEMYDEYLKEHPSLSE